MNIQHKTERDTDAGNKLSVSREEALGAGQNRGRGSRGTDFQLENKSRGCNVQLRECSQ